MNVGLFNDSFPPTIDGVANAVKNYADILTQKQWITTVITPEYPNIIDNYPYEVYRYSSVKFRGRMPYRVGNPFSPLTLLELSRKNFDLLHVHCPFASAVLAHEIKISKFSKKPPIVFTYHTKFDIDIDNYVQNQPLNKISKKFILNNIKFSDEVWCVSNGAVKSLRKLGYDGDVIVMENGTDFEKGKSHPDDILEIKRIHRLEDSTPVFLFCGRVMWYKNVKLILDGLMNLIRDGCKFKVIFIGDGPDRPAVEAYARQIGIPDEFVIFTGAIYNRKKLRAYFSIADLLLFPSTYDTSGLVVKEAAACECPSLLVYGSCAADGITDMKNGILINEDSESFSKKVSEILQNPDILKTMGRNAQNTVYLSWNDAIDKAQHRYEIIIENKFKKSK